MKKPKIYKHILLDIEESSELIPLVLTLKEEREDASENKHLDFSGYPTAGDYDLSEPSFAYQRKHKNYKVDRKCL